MLDAPFCMEKAGALLHQPEFIYCGLLRNPESVVTVS